MKALGKEDEARRRERRRGEERSLRRRTTTGGSADQAIKIQDDGFSSTRDAGQTLEVGSGPGEVP